MVEYIDDNQQLVIKLVEDNNKREQSPKINTTITLNTKHVYKFIQKAIASGKTNEAYIMELQFKTLLRCIWQTRWNKIEHPNYKYLNGITTFVKLYANDIDKEFMPKRTITISKGCRHINQDDFTLLQYCLYPSFTFNSEQLTESLWDKYLFILQNLILATNINARKQLKDFKIERLKAAETDEEKQKINADYLKEIDATKNENTFKLINHLNYLFYNHPNDNHDMLWRFVLLRWTSIDSQEPATVGDLDAYLDETICYDEQEYKHVIKQLYDIATSDINLLKFYIAVNIYSYHFVHKDVYKYIINYVKLMTNYIVGHQQSLREWETEQINDIVKSFSILSIVKPLEDILIDIIRVHLQAYSYKTNNIVNFIKESFPSELLDKYSIEDVAIELKARGAIVALFNKCSELNYDKVVKELNNYGVDLLESVYFDKFAHTIIVYTPYIVRLISQRDKEFSNKLYNYVINMVKTKGVNNNVIELCGCYSVLTYDVRYYELIQTFATDTNYYDIDFIIATEKFIPYMNHIQRLSYHGIIDGLLIEKYTGINELKGWRKCKIEDISYALE